MEKETGVEYNRQAFLPASQQAPSGVAGTRGLLLLALAVAVIAVFGFIGYRSFGHNDDNVPADTRALVQVDLQIAQIQDRLDHVEQENQRLASALALANSKKLVNAAQMVASAAAAQPKIIYRVSPTIQQPRVTTPDPATLQKLAALQQGLGAVQNDASGNREAWQATADRLADVAGQVGSQSGAILHSQDELNRLLAQTDRSSLSFELRRGSSPEQVGPVTVALKSTNAKNQRYTMCVYVQQSCVELKDRTLFEVVQVALARNVPPLQVIATTIGKDNISGYVEVPREPAAR
jgi:hypothetical protein